MTKVVKNNKNKINKKYIQQLKQKLTEKNSIKEVKEVHKPQSESEDSDSDLESNSESSAKDNLMANTNNKDTEPAEFENFDSFGLEDDLLQALQALNFTKPTPIQSASLPPALSGRDIIGIAQTGSGKTAAFTLPILHFLYKAQTPYFALILAPTRELAYQITETVTALGSTMGVRVATIVGGMDMVQQAKELMRKPHVIVATPGRLMDHLETTRGFSLRSLQFLIMDEADRLLELEFGPVLDKILSIIPKKRTTYLFSATLTSKIDKLQRASLSNPVKVAVSNKYATVDTLVQSILVVPDGYKNTYLIHLLNESTGSIIVFTRTCAHAQHVSLLARLLGFDALPLHGQLSQAQRLGALNQFKSGQKSILVATDVAARGLDIPSVDLVLNYDIPTDSKAYVHRVGRTARAGRNGKAISLVTQYDLDLLLKIEKVIGIKMTKETVDRGIIVALHQSVDKASVVAIRKVKEFHEKRKERKRN
ncbi:RNA-dependent ATPase [Martiniozyma asiatica (nom. inval.)]|nr:RNA-dependent ATPase [Martiniozyma asiatica]